MNARLEGARDTTTPPPAFMATPALWFWAGLLILFGYRAYQLVAGNVPLFPDEAYYADWSHEPSFGYYSKPPIVAWMIHVSTSWLGDSEAAIRTPALLCYAGAAWALYDLGSRLFGSWAGVLAALLFSSMPMMFVLSQSMSTDAPLTLFWVLALRALLLAFRDPAARSQWLWAGLWLGLGLMSKYTIALLAVTAVAMACVDRNVRPSLATVYPYLGAAICAVLVLPNLWWNYTNDWPTFAHTAELVAPSADTLSIAAAGTFVLEQFVVVGPGLAVLMVVAVVCACAANERRAERLLVLLSIPLIAIAIFESLVSGAHLNWTLPAMPGLALATAAWARRTQRTAYLVAALALNLFLGAAVMHAGLLADALGTPLSKRLDPYAYTRGWPDLGADVAAKMPVDTLRILFDDRKTMASLRYYGPKLALPSVLFNPGRQRTNQYALRDDLDTVSAEGPFLLVARHAAINRAQLGRYFSAVEFLGSVKSQHHPDYALTVNLWRVDKFLGYRE